MYPVASSKSSLTQMICIGIYCTLAVLPLTQQLRKLGMVP
jgi:hypothetical protein